MAPTSRCARYRTRSTATTSAKPAICSRTGSRWSIGITGSYGKTTTKFCVGAVLSADRPTLVTPDSYNSFLGVIRTINEHLEWRHRAFVVEMGMFRRGDIAELCELVHPKIGVITAIGPMHLERLGSIEADRRRQGRAAGRAARRRPLRHQRRRSALPGAGGARDGAGDVVRDRRSGHRTRVMASSAHKARPTVQRRHSTQRRQPPLGHRRARPTHPQKTHRRCRSSHGTSGWRTVARSSTCSSTVPTARPIPVSAGLLGRHNVSNLLAAAAVGRVLGIEPARIAEGLAKVQAPPHRLQPIHNRRAGIVVIDDAYNSNPDGAAAALEVLREHPAKRRLLVTPGMVELGELEAELNRRFGEQAGAVCDVAILVGPRAPSRSAKGLASGGHGLREHSRRARHRRGHSAAGSSHARRRRGPVRERPPRHLCGTRGPSSRERLSSWIGWACLLTFLRTVHVPGRSWSRGACLVVYRRLGP